MARKKIIALSEEDARKLRALVRDALNEELNTTGRPGARAELHQAPDLYVAKTPAGGIAGMVGATPGVAVCDIYRIYVSGVTPALVQVGELDKRVHNIDVRAVYGDEYIKAVRDKFGFWLACSGFVECCDDGGGDGEEQCGCYALEGCVDEAGFPALRFSWTGNEPPGCDKPHGLEQGQLACPPPGTPQEIARKWPRWFNWDGSADLSEAFSEFGCDGGHWATAAWLNGLYCDAAVNEGGPPYLQILLKNCPQDSPTVPGAEPGGCRPGTHWIASVGGCYKCPDGTRYDPVTQECYQFGTYPTAGGGIQIYTTQLWVDSPTAGWVLTVNADGTVTQQANAATSNWTEFTASVTTTDGTQTTAYNLTLDDNTLYEFEIWVQGRYTTGGGGSAGDAYVAAMYDAFERHGTAAARINGAAAPTKVFEVIQPAMSGPTATTDTSTNDARVRVTGVASATYNWTVTGRYRKRT